MPSHNVSRRQAVRVVGAVGISAVAGCNTPFTRGDSCSDGINFSLQKIRDRSVTNEATTTINGLPYAAQTVVTDALNSEAGEASSRGYYSPDPRKEYVVSPESKFYHIETSDHGQSLTTGSEYSFNTDVNESSLSDDDQVRSFAELPAHDRESLLSAIRDPDLLDAPHYTPSPVMFAYEHDDAQEQSVFMPETTSHYIELNEILLQLTFEERRTVEITTTTVSTELVAESSEAFFQYMSEEHGVVLGSLTGEQREILDQATGGTHTECQPYSEAFRDLREQLTTGEDGSVLLAQYDSNWYFVHFS